MGSACFSQEPIQCVGVSKSIGRESKRHKMLLFKGLHEIIGCGWIQVVHSLVSVSITEQDNYVDCART